ncbi:hypothetical protein IH824_19170 [candidate division KSB1 bacterium]|nr:hypothetical protein [candidate division KSB1 bacterium]
MIKFKFILCVLFAVLLSLTSFASPKEVKEKIEKTLKFSNPSGEKEVIVDNINGSIEVEGYDGKEVQLVVNKTIFARSQERIDLARKKIRLEITEEDNTIELYVDAPYRRRDGSMNHRGWRHDGYDVTFDFKLKVPRDANVYLKTINQGSIEVRGVSGDYDLHNINGRIDASGLSGSGRIYALNGGVTVDFEQNPKKDCYFGSLNGEIEVTFLAGLEADFRFKTFNGDVYTDFDISYLSPRQATTKRRKGKYVYKADKAFGARVGQGGPEIEFDGFNGDIYVNKK